MPQMAPISWVTLYLFFSILFIMSWILNFFLFKYMPKTKTLTQNKLTSQWKWYQTYFHLLTHQDFHPFH